MITMGCDVGSLFAKAVVLKGDDLAASTIVRTTGNIKDEISGIISRVLADAGVERGQVDALGATGSGAELVPGADFREDGLVCVAAATAFYLPEVRFAIDVGGQSITAMLIDPDGEVKNFMRNDKCASGSGRFLEMMSHKLGLELEAVDGEVAKARKMVELSNQCGVFAESEVITHQNNGESVPDIMAGVCAAVARLVAAQGRRFGDAKHYTLVGGVSRVKGVTDMVAKRLGGTYHPFPHDPGLAAAIGAALLEPE